MASVDAFIASVLWWYVIPCGVTGVLLVMFVTNIHSLRQRWIAWLMNWMSSNDIHATKGIGNTLFADLHQMESCDLKLKNKGLIRILEIGCGTGSNFVYFPKNSRLIVVEPNPYTKKYFAKNWKMFPELTLESYFEGYAEEMYLIPDSSIDAVVSTGVLCCVRDAQAVLKEILRVLSPGGKFFYAEHTCHQSGSWKYQVQRCIDPLWRVIFGGCTLTRDISFLIKQNHFKHVLQYKIHRPWGKILGIFLHPSLIGIATK